MIQRHTAQTLLLCLIIPFFFSSCFVDRGSQPEKVIASVRNSQLTLDQALSNIPEFILHEDTVAAIQIYSNQWIETEVAADYARRSGIRNSTEYKRRMALMERELLVTILNEIIMDRSEGEITVSVEEAQNYYMTYRDQFTFQEPYIRFRLISTRTRTEAENANRELIAGQEWDDILQRYSVEPDLQLEHSKQYWPFTLAANRIPPIQQNLRTMGITERSPIHFYNGLFHLAQITDIRTEGEYPDLDWLIPQIQTWLALEKSRRIVNAYLRNLYLQAEASNEIERLPVTDLQNLLLNETN